MRLPERAAIDGSFGDEDTAPLVDGATKPASAGWLGNEGGDEIAPIGAVTGCAGAGGGVFASAVAKARAF
jgi:hypothetical protein